MSEVKKDCPALQDGSCQEKDCTNCTKYTASLIATSQIATITEENATGLLGI